MVEEEKMSQEEVLNEFSAPETAIEEKETDGAGTELPCEETPAEQEPEIAPTFVEEHTVDTFEEPKKEKFTVRGGTLKKLLKYDFRALFKFLLPCYAALLIAAALGAVSLVIAEHTAEPGQWGKVFGVLISLLMFYVFAVFTCEIACSASIVKRYHKNIFTSEGYLTLSLPASAEEHIFSKVISAVVTLVLTLLVALSSIFVVTAPYASDIFPEFVGVLREVFKAFARDPVVSSLFAVEFLLFGGLLLSFGVQLIYSCVCVGHLFANKNRWGLWIIAFVAYFVLSNAVSSLSQSLDITVWIGKAPANIHIALWIGIVLHAGFNVLAFIWQRYVIGKRINLS